MKRLICLLSLLFMMFLFISPVLAVDTDEDGFDSSIDCDDNDPTEFPGQVWYADCDGDGFFRDTPVIACDEAEANANSPCNDSNPPDGGWSHTAGLDCDDEDPTEFPGQAWYADCDEDGFFRDTAVVACDETEANANSPCGDGLAPDGGWSHTASTSGDCDDSNATEFPGQVWYADCDGDGFFRDVAVIACDEAEANANSPCNDGNPPDGGWSHTAGTDCDDSIASINPDAIEIPDNGIDENCDGSDVLVRPFTYQGRLLDNNIAANGFYDFQFKLYDDPNIMTGVQVGLTKTVEDVDVIDGYFIVELSFGTGFDGDAFWLDIAVRPYDSTNAHTSLSPRQLLTPSPYSLYSSDTDLLDGYNFSEFAFSSHNHNGVYAPSSHSHDGTYALTSHNHSGVYSPFSHHHDSDYASIAHNHAGVYSPSGHDHDADYSSIAHNHSGVYSPVSHEHDNRYYTETELQISGGSNVHWNNLTNVPAGFADGIDNVGSTDADWTISGSNMYSAVSNNIGIGIASPEKKLHIKKKSNTDHFQLKLANPNGGGNTSAHAGILFHVEDDQANRGKGGILFESIGNWNRGKMHFLLNNAQDNSQASLADSAMTITNDGKVGIGTTTPTEKLSVNGDVQVIGQLTPDGGIIRNGSITIESKSGNVEIKAGTTTITVDPSGGVTINSGSAVNVSANTVSLTSTGNMDIHAGGVLDIQGSTVKINDSTATRQAARVGDSVNVPYPTSTGTIVTGSSTVFIGP